MRGNPGGADSSYKPLAELVYAGTVAQPGLDALATPENVSVLESLLPGLPDDVQAQVRLMTEQMRSHPGEFVRVVEDGVTQYPEVLRRRHAWGS